jgi:hypothetical protein
LALVRARIFANAWRAPVSNFIARAIAFGLPRWFVRNDEGSLYGRKSGHLAEREGFEPSIPETGMPDFESGAFDHSATSPSPVERAL